VRLHPVRVKPELRDGSYPSPETSDPITPDRSSGRVVEALPGGAMRMPFYGSALPDTTL
jgi:hypothetical protein